MSSKFIDLAAHILASIAIVCCAPYIILVCIREMWKEIDDNARMHRDIEQFLNKQDDDEYGYYQAHTW